MLFITSEQKIKAGLCRQSEFLGIYSVIRELCSLEMLWSGVGECLYPREVIGWGAGILRVSALAKPWMRNTDVVTLNCDNLTPKAVPLKTMSPILTNRIIAGLMKLLCCSLNLN